MPLGHPERPPILGYQGKAEPTHSWGFPPSILRPGLALNPPEMLGEVQWGFPKILSMFPL